MIGQKGLPPTYGGVEHHVANLGAGLVGRGHQVTVFCRPYYSGDLRAHPEVSQAQDGSMTYRGIRLVMIPSIKTKHFDAISHSTLSTLSASREHFDIIHYHGIGPSLVSFLPRLCGAPVVSTVHTLDFRRDKWGPLAKLSLRAGLLSAVTFPQRTICVSRTICDYLGDAVETTYIPNGVRDPYSWGAEQIQWLRKHGLEPQRYLLFVGRLVEEKRCHQLIRAIEELDLPYRLAIAGNSSHSNSYVHRLKALAGAETVFLGNVYDHRLSALFANAALFVLPSAVEGLPLVLIEAMLHGTPVLASDIAENLEVVDGSPTDEPLGLTFNTDNDDSLKEALTYALSDPPSLGPMASRAQEHVRVHFDWQGIVEATERVYAGAIAS